MTHFEFSNIVSSIFSVRSFAILIIALAVWSIVWKGFALWFSARNHQKWWFVVLLILNTAGVAEIIYLAFFRRDKQSGETKSLFNNPFPPSSESEEVAETPGA